MNIQEYFKVEAQIGDGKSLTARYDSSNGDSRTHLYLHRPEVLSGGLIVYLDEVAPLIEILQEMQRTITAAEQKS